MKDQVAVIGVGCTKFGDLFDKSYEDLICDPAFEAYEDAGIDPQEIQAAYPPEILEEAERLATWLQELTARYGEQLHVRIVDPQSAEGFFKSLRYWIRRYPAFVVNRRKRVTGWSGRNVASQTPGLLSLNCRATTGPCSSPRP